MTTLGPPGDTSDVLVIGGGVAGLACALYLTRAGARVTVAESNRVGSGASSGNAGWLCPAQAGPLPEPGLVTTGIRMLVHPASALYFAPRALPALVPWLLRFASYCTPSAYAEGARALSALGVRVFELVDELGLEIELHRDELLAEADMRALEPALHRRVRSGVSVEQHWHIQPEQFVAKLADRVRGQGVEIIEGAEVQDIETSGTRISALRTAAGSRAAAARRPRGLQPARRRHRADRRHLGVQWRQRAPRSAADPSDRHRRRGGDRALTATAGERMGGNASDRSRRAADHRPRATAQNVWIATAYSMLGMTVSLPAAEQLSELIASGRRPTLLEPFRADRFRSVPGVKPKVVR